MKNGPSNESLGLTLERVGRALYETRLRKYEPELALISSGIHYGKTQALVIGSFSDNKAYKVVTSNDEPIDKASQEREDAIAQHLEINQYEHDNRASCLPAQLALDSYRGFRVLFGERLHAQNYSSIQNIDQKFLDLPGEIRNRIYELYLVVDPDIDLSPKTSMKRRSDIDCAVGRYLKLKPILRLLRLSRQINSQASDIFYGDNEFRFTSKFGWCYLLAFLRKIGLANVSRLRRLAVPVPYEGRDYSASWGPSMDSVASSLHRMGLNDDDQSEPPSIQACIRGCIKILEKAGNLEVLRLVLPISFRFADNSLKPLKLNASRFNNLTVVLVHLHNSEYRDETVGGTHMPITEIRNLPGDDYEEYEYADPEAWAKAKG
ncbi:hypothetical protein LTR36_002410 [Oleoguttula mirabilis]|uniref:Uncharacterized protein n=1 Tax=Oleoguttula mirabilis TaxID=1507867 RepID=A0AAV9JKJ2_9PEZI|nr:hypothetical protein LTR36_002410 [Oleoguttula mirabilis]